MGRFDLNKGDRFKLNKSEGLSKLKVVLGWKGGADLDACAFLLNEDGVISNDADFVYYKSNNREEDFNKEKFGNKKVWRSKTRPMSADNSVMGSIDDQGDEEEDSDDGNEEMYVNLEKVDGSVTEIVFCASVYPKPGYETCGDVDKPYISIVDEETGNELCRYNLKEKFNMEDAVEAGKLVCDEEGEWSFETIGKGYTGGMQTLIDIYA